MALHIFSERPIISAVIFLVASSFIFFSLPGCWIYKLTLAALSAHSHFNSENITHYKQNKKHNLAARLLTPSSLKSFLSEFSKIPSYRTIKKCRSKDSSNHLRKNKFLNAVSPLTSAKKKASNIPTKYQNDFITMPLSVGLSMGIFNGIIIKIIKWNGPQIRLSFYVAT